MNRGKDFEETFKKQMVTSGFDVNRVCDNTAGYMGGRNICDFITYVYPNIFYLELKSTKGNTLPFSNISKNQWAGLLEKENIEGAGAGIVVWFLEHDKTFFVSADCLQHIKCAEGADICYNIAAAPNFGDYSESKKVSAKKRCTYVTYEPDMWCSGDETLIGSTCYSCDRGYLSERTCNYSAICTVYSYRFSYEYYSYS